jgi:hypothetical protein
MTLAVRIAARLHFPRNYRISKRENAESRRITKPFAARRSDFGAAALPVGARIGQLKEIRHG